MDYGKQEKSINWAKIAEEDETRRVFEKPKEPHAEDGEC